MKHLNKDDFEEEVMKADKPVIVDFYADWCAPCKVMGPVVTQVEKEHKQDIIFAKVNIDESPTIALDYRVLSIPTLLFVKDGKIMGRVEEAVTKSVIDKKIEKYFGK